MNTPHVTEVLSLPDRVISWAISLFAKREPQRTIEDCAHMGLPLRFGKRTISPGDREYHALAGLIRFRSHGKMTGVQS